MTLLSRRGDGSGTPGTGQARAAAGAATALASGLVAVAALSVLASTELPLTRWYVAKATAAFAAAAMLVRRGVDAHHRFDRFGAPNLVTTARAVLVALVAAVVGESGGSTVAATATAVGLAALALDGLDGWLARRTSLASPFGARFDMEVDAALILALSVLVWQAGKAGAWILGSGLMRYAFVALGQLWPWLREPLPPSRRRQTVCVLQTAALLAALAPPVPARVAAPIAAAALTALGASFLIDLVGLWRGRGHRFPIQAAGRRRALGGVLRELATLLAALALLDASLSFGNVWPTPMIRWHGELSIELAAGILLLAAARRYARAPSSRALTTLWLVLAVGHYADVTAQGLYGREVNLFWDLRFAPGVAGLFGKAGRLPALAAGLAAALAAGLLLAASLGWAIRRLQRAMADRAERRLVVGAAAGVAALFAAEALELPIAWTPAFTPPVTATYARQVRLLAAAARGSRAVPPSPAFDSDLSRIAGADVILLFLESYGAVTYDRREIAARAAAGRRALDEAIHDTHRSVVSAFVESPTFGGSSWLAHISLMSGVEVRDPDVNALLMRQTRETIVTLFARHGYRTVALMPGLWQRWPEGAFYRFDDIYGGERLGYRGPQFGWFDMTDQFALARLDDLELGRRARRPLFVFFPTISTHTPFTPVPPYQPAWARMLTDRPYDEADLRRSYERQPDWLDLGPSYAEAVSYSLTTLAGYLRQHDGHDLVLIVIGDHQPPALVSGPAASWDVPIHVVSGRPAVTDRLTARGFRPGLEPRRPSLGRMHQLVPLLLDAFGDSECTGSC